MLRFWWLNLVRGTIALLIGITILVWPHISRNLAANFLAMYWLSSGLLSVRRGVSTHQKKRLSLVEGIFEIIVGAAILLRSVYEHYLASGLTLRIFGLIAILVGVVRISCGFGASDMTRERSLGSFLLGIFEVGLGVLLVFADQLDLLLKLFAGGWAFTGGILLILQSLHLRKGEATSV